MHLRIDDDNGDSPLAVLLAEICARLIGAALLCVVKSRDRTVQKSI
jgi:hypothetical protein